MLEFSASLESLGLPSTVSSEEDITRIVEGFESYLKPRNMWQFYVLDVKAERAAVADALSKKDVVPWSGVDVANKTVVELANILRDSGKVEGLRKLEGRFKTHVPGPVAAGLVQAAFVNLSDNAALADAWIRIVDVLNVPQYEEWNEDTKIALDSIRNRMKYTRLEENGPKMGPITAK